MNEPKVYRAVLAANLTTLLLIILLVILLQIRSILSPVLSALLIAYLLYPVVKWGNRIGIHKAITTLTLVMLLIVSTLLIGVSFLPAIQQQIRTLSQPVPHEVKVMPSRSSAAPADGEVSPLVEPEVIIVQESLAQNRARQLVDQFFGKLEAEGWPVADKAKIVQEVTDRIASESLLLLRELTGLAVEWGRFLMIFFFVLVFALLDGDRMHRSLVQLIPNEFYESTLFILDKSHQILANYLRGLFVENTVLGLLTMTLLFPVCMVTELSLLLAFIVSLIIALTNVIRIIGPIIGAIFGAFLALAATNDLRVVLAILIIALIVQILDNVLVLPLVMQDQVNIHPVVCLLGVIVGGILAGVLGMILAIPVISGIKVVYRVLSVEMKRFVEPSHYGDYTIE